MSDASGNPLQNVAVSFRVTAGGGTVVPATPVMTNSSGVAAVTSWTLGPTPGTNQLSASVSGSSITGNPSVFVATGIVGNGNRLVFIVQPSNVGVRKPITPAVQVQVQDAQGNPVSSAKDAITMALGTNPTAATLGGTTTVNAVAGVATFSNLQLDKAGTGYTLNALGSGLVSGTSNPFNVTNSPPTAAADAYSTNEDTPLTIGAPGVLSNDSDPDGDPLTAVKLTNPSHGSVTLNPNGSFTYTPQANFNGSDSFTYAANDGTQNSSPATVTITVNPVNDPPSFTVGPNQVTTAGSPLQTVNGWATNISPGPNEAGQTVTFEVTNDNNGAFLQQPAVDGSGTLTYQPTFVVVQQVVVTVTVTAHDNGGTANGGQDTSAPQQFTITINPAP